MIPLPNSGGCDHEDSGYFSGYFGELYYQAVFFLHGSLPANTKHRSLPASPSQRDWVPCTIYLPYHIVPREGFEDGVIKDKDDYIRFRATVAIR
jgi:hypothetical protein